MSEQFIRHWHLSREGCVSLVEAIVRDGLVTVTDTGPGGTTVTQMSGDIWAVIDGSDELRIIGTGATVLEWGGLDDARLLGALDVQAPWLQDLDAKAWDALLEALPEEHRNRFREDLDAEGVGDVWEGVQAWGGDLVHRRIRLNGHPGAILANKFGATVVAIDEEGTEIPFNKPFLTYAFARESGAPVVFEGSFEAGTFSNQVHALQARGDLGNWIGFFWSERPANLVAADYIDGEEWQPAYLRFVIGLPGCSEDQLRQLDALDVPGSKVWVDATRINLDDLTQVLIGRDERVAEMADALRNPNSDPGRQVSEVIERVADPSDVADWDDVDNTLWNLTI